MQKGSNKYKGLALKHYLSSDFSTTLATQSMEGGTYLIVDPMYVFSFDQN